MQLRLVIIYTSSQQILKPVSWQNYRTAQNRVVHLIRHAKQVFYRNSINANLDNPKNLWKIIRNIAPSKCSNLPNHLTIDGTTFSDPKAIADLFNDHFANITNSVKLNNPLSNPSWDHLTDFISSKLPSNTLFTIPLMREEFVTKTLQRLSPTKAAGLDGLNGHFLKIAAPSISSILTRIYNRSISIGVFPDSWKIAKVSPLFKSGSLFDRSNYRPISVLATISKVLERHVYASFYTFLTEYDLLTDNQFGFRESRSCELAVTDLTDNILTNMDNSSLNGLLLIDLKKAFDLVDHSTLLFKLSSYGSSPLAMKWFTSYLSDRRQLTSFKGSLSDILPVLTGVPQGSILGPLFFLLFINDLPLHLSHSNSTMFADDTTILASSSTVHDLSLKLNQVAYDVSSWAENNKMAVNTSKTKSMLIFSSRKAKYIGNPSLSLVMNGNEIEQVSHAKMLGVVLDSNLNWAYHIDNLCSTVNSRLALLRRIQPYLNQVCSIRFYNSCIHSHIIYCSVAWGNCSKTLLLRILRLQKRAARIIFNADLLTPSVLLFSKLKWIPIFDLIKLRKLLLLFNILINPNAPLCFKDRFSFLSDSRPYRTRASLYDLKLPLPRTDFGKRTFLFSGSTLFNALDPSLKQLACPTASTPDALTSRITALKLKLRTFFLNKLTTTNHLEDLFCYSCRFFLNCKCISS